MNHGFYSKLLEATTWVTSLGLYQIYSDINRFNRKGTSTKKNGNHTVDGRNPAPPWMVETQTK